MRFIRLPRCGSSASGYECHIFCRMGNRRRDVGRHPNIYDLCAVKLRQIAGAFKRTAQGFTVRQIDWHHNSFKHCSSPSSLRQSLRCSCRTDIVSEVFPSTNSNSPPQRALLCAPASCFLVGRQAVFAAGSSRGAAQLSARMPTSREKPVKPDEAAFRRFRMPRRWRLLSARSRRVLQR